MLVLANYHKVHWRVQLVYSNHQTQFKAAARAELSRIELLFSEDVSANIFVASLRRFVVFKKGSDCVSLNSPCFHVRISNRINIMVVFTCNHCGESLKKNTVEKHIFRCRKDVSVSCMVSVYPCMKQKIYFNFCRTVIEIIIEKATALTHNALQS